MLTQAIIFNAKEIGLWYFHYLIELLKQHYPGLLAARYEIEETEDHVKDLHEIAKARKCFLKGEELDIRKAANLLMDDFRAGRLGKITLERP